jgi:hypothetical protein
MTSYYLRPHNADPRYVQRLESECTWILNKIEEVASTKLPNRPRAIKEIEDLRRQLRHRELEIAFMGPEWTKYEKYGIWERLSM